MVKTESTPLVTIGMPTFNDERYIAQAIESLLGQSRGDFELLISDNASTDSTPEICHAYAARDPRIQYVRHPRNQGVINNFNYVIHAARGRYFMWAASDDYWHPRFLETVVRTIEAAGCVGAFTPYTFTEEDGTPIGGTRRFEYASKFAALRLWKLATVYDDACFYSLWDLEKIRGTELPHWWRVNVQSALNCAYPVLFRILTAGSLKIGGEEPMWFNRLSPTSIRFPHIQHPIVRFLRLVLHKANVFWECVRYISLGSRSFFLTALTVPMLLIRFIRDCFQPVGLILRRSAKSIRRIPT